MLATFASLVLVVAVAALWLLRRRTGRSLYHRREVDTPSDRSKWSGLDAEVDGIRFDRSKERIELWRRSG